MTFQAGGWDECQAAKIAPLVVPYLQGRTLDIGSGPGKVFPRCIGIDIADVNGRPITDMRQDGLDLSMFADGSIDNVFSSFMLHQLERQQAIAALREWVRVLKVGGYLTLYLPNNAHCPKREDEDGDPRQRWNIYKGDACTLLDIEVKCGFDLITCEDRNDGDEFGALTIVRKRADQEWVEDMWVRQPKGALRALVIRYGAIGDAIVSAGILPLLKRQGYHVTYNCTPKIKDVLRHDPNIDEWLIQETDFVPNELLGAYWRGLEERYDKIINLSESVEGLLLALPGRLNHSYSDGTRRKLCGGVNYQERTADIADVEYDFAGSRFYATPAEREWAQREHDRKKAPVVVWCVNGSSAHKVYPFIQIVCGWLLERTPCHIVLYGDPGVGKDLAKGIIDCLREDKLDVKRITSVAGKWAIRQSLAYAQVADVVVGPETGPLNAVAMEDVPKVIYLSHSSADNLTKHWRNTTTLIPNHDKVPCYPCHRLHHTWEYCVKDDKTGAALCASSIKPEAVFRAIAIALGAQAT